MTVPHWTTQMATVASKVSLTARVLVVGPRLRQGRLRARQLALGRASTGQDGLLPNATPCLARPARR